MASVAELKVMLNATDNMSSVLKSAGGSFGHLESAAMAAGKAIGVVAIAGVGALAAGLGLAVKSAADFESQMSAVKAVSGATQQEMADLSGMALQLGKDTSFSATEAGQGIEELVKAGVSVADVMGGAAAASLNLAAAGAISVGEAAIITSNALNVFNKSGEEAAHFADVIAGSAVASASDVHQFGFSLAAAGAVANAVGFSFEDLATGISVMAQNGLKGSDAGTSLKTMMLNLQPVTDKQVSLFRELGIVTKDGSNQFFDAAGSVKSMAQVAGVLKTALAGMTKQQQLAALEVMFGSDAIRAAAIFANEGAAGFDAMAESMAKITAESVAAERLDNLAGSMEKMKGSLMTAAIAVGTAFLPALRSMVDGITTMVNTNMPRIEAFAQGMAGAIASIDFGAALGAIGTAFSTVGVLIQSGLQIGTDALYGAGQAVAEWATTVGAQIPGIGPIIEAAGSIAGSALTGLAAILRGDINAAMAAFTQSAIDAGPAMDAVASSASGLQGALGPLVPVIAGIAAAFAAFTILTTIVGWVVAVAGAWAGLTATFAASGGTIAGIVAILGGPITVAVLAVAAVIGVLTSAWIGNWGDIQGITESAVSAVGAAVMGLGDLIVSAWDGMNAATAAAFSALAGVVAAAWGSLNADTQVALSNLAAAVGEAWNAIPALIAAAMAAITATVAAGWAAVTAAVDGAMAAITAAATAGWSAVQAASDAAMALIPPAVTARFGEAAAAAQSGMAQVVAAVAGAAGAAGAAAAAVGSAIVSGLSNAIQAGVASVANAAANLVRSAIGAANAAADAHSPSKKTYELGVDLVDGLREGLGTGTDLFNEIIAQFGDFVSAAREYRGVAETILSIEEQTKDFREGAQRDAIRREWEMVDVVSEHLSLKRDLITAERDLLPARQAAAAADREISSITRGSLEDRQRLITIDAERGRLKLEELKLERAAAGEQRTIKEQQLALEERLKAVKGDKAAEAQIKLEIDALKLRSDALKGDLELFRDKDKALQIEAEQIRLTNSLASTAAKLRREELIDAVKNGEDALIPHKQMIDLLEAEIAVWKSGEAVVANVTKNFVNSQALRIAALKDESLATAERIDAGTQLVAKLEQEGLISTTTAGKLRDLATAALTGKGTAGEFYNAINLLITALGGEATAAGVAQEKVGRLAGTISTDATPATTGLSQATDIAREAWEKSEPVIDAVTGAIATELDPAMKAQIETTMKSIEANNAEMMKLKELQDQVGWTTDEIIELNETPPDIDTSSVDDATKSMDKARKAAEKLKEALDDLDKNTSDNAKDAFEKAKGKGINTAPNVNPDFAYAQGGMVPGPVGAPMMAMVHGGERVLTPEQQKDISQGGGVQSTSVTNVTFNGWTDEHAIRRWESWQQKQRLLFGGVR